MARWFDDYAKKAAERNASVRVGRTTEISRRRLIVGGSAAVGAAWTAPMLMASSAAATGLSACPPAQICGSNCCPTGVVCDPTGGINGTPGCVGEVGGTCGNSGTGKGGCRLQTVHCNGNAHQHDECNYCKDQPVCGGEGAVCSASTDCAQLTTAGFFQDCSNADAYPTTSTVKYCRLKCSVGTVGDAYCQTEGTAGATNRFCKSESGLAYGYCAAHCTTDNQCMPTGHCVNPYSGTGTDTSYCAYTAQA